MSNRMNRMTVKLNPYLTQKLKDMKLVFKINYSTLIRTMMEAYFEKHSEVIDKLIEDYYEKNK